MVAVSTCGAITNARPFLPFRGGCRGGRFVTSYTVQSPTKEKPLSFGHLKTLTAPSLSHYDFYR